MIGTGFAFVTAQLVNIIPAGTPTTRLASAAAIVVTFDYAAGIAVSFFLPEPASEELPE